MPARSSRTSPFAGPFAPAALDRPTLGDDGRGVRFDSFSLLGTGADEPVTRDFDERAEEDLAIDPEG